jgi:hypothetical protein
MNDAQLRLYRYEASRWRDARRSRGQPAREEDRHSLHTRVLGRDKSSLQFTNAEFDKVLAAFRAESEPGNLDAQLALIDQPEHRATVIRGRLHLLSLYIGLKPGHESSYIAGIASKLFGIDQLIDLSDVQLAKLEGVLQRRVRQIHEPARVEEIFREAAEQGAKTLAIIHPPKPATAPIDDEPPF